MVTIAKNYGLREINKKLYLTINGVTYSFHSGYTSMKPNPTLSVPSGSFSMPPNSQVDFDINISPWFYDPEIFDKNYYPYIYNTNVVKFVKLVKNLTVFSRLPLSLAIISMGRLRVLLFMALPT